MSKSMTPKLSNATADGNGASVSFRFLNGVLVTEVRVTDSDRTVAVTERPDSNQSGVGVYRITDTRTGRSVSVCAMTEARALYIGGEKLAAGAGSPVTVEG